MSDICGILSESAGGEAYWIELKQKLLDEGCVVDEICHRLKIEANDGKKYLTDCANMEGVFRIIQSIQSPKAELFRHWLAQVGDESIQEFENPELIMERARMHYKLKGYSDNWIGMRMRGIAISEELVDEWQKRGAEEKKDHEILTAEISKAAFGITPPEYKKIKGLKRENLRDHMDDLELIFTMLGECATNEIHRAKDSRGIQKLKSDVNAGGDIAGNARKALEKQLKRPIVSGQNYLEERELQRRIR